MVFNFRIHKNETARAACQHLWVTPKKEFELSATLCILDHYLLSALWHF